MKSMLASDVVLKSFTIDCYSIIPDEVRLGNQFEFDGGTYFVSEINRDRYLSGDRYEIKPLYEVTFTRVS